MKYRPITVMTVFLCLLLPACGQEEKMESKPSGVSDIVNAARTQIGTTTEYDPAHRALSGEVML